MRNYEHTPRPDVEHHHHVRELIERQEKRSDDRTYHRNRVKAIEERNDLIKDSKMSVITDFWCEKCRKDFKAVAFKQVEDDWSNISQQIAFYKTKCERGHWCIRLVTDKHKDGFYIRSRFMSLDRGNHYADIVQPFETNFNLLYGKR